MSMVTDKLCVEAAKVMCVDLILLIIASCCCTSGEESGKGTGEVAFNSELIDRNSIDEWPHECCR